MIEEEGGGEKTGGGGNGGRGGGKEVIRETGLLRDGCHNFVPMQRHPGAVPVLQSVDKQVWCDHCCILNVIDIGVREREGGGGGRGKR